MGTKRQKLTRRRNFSKARLLGFFLHDELLTEEEILIHNELRKITAKLLSSWDEQSKIFSDKLKSLE